MLISEAQPNSVVYRNDERGNRIYGMLDRVFPDRVVFRPQAVRQEDGSAVQGKAAVIVAQMHGILPNLHQYSAFADSLVELSRELEAARRKHAADTARNVANFNAQVQQALGAHRIKQGWVKSEQAEADDKASASREQAAEAATVEAWT